MSPPTEQLIRDYINRLSVAAQGRLSRDDRRALMDRTRGYVEHNTGLSGPATMLEVAAVLSRLGDPSLVVAKEVQRLAEIRGDGEPPSATRPGRLARAGRREPGRLSASWHWPARPGNLTDLHAMLTGGRTDAAGSSERDATGRAETAATGTPATGMAATETPATRTPATPSAGTAVPGSGLEALGLVGARADDAGGADTRGNGQQRPSWPHGPAVRRDEGTPGQVRQDAQDHAAVAPAETAGLAAGADAPAAGADAPEALAVAEPALETDPSGGHSDAHEPDDGAAKLAAAEVAASDTGELTAADIAAIEPVASDTPPLAGLRRLSAAVVAWSRENTLESVATILLGAGGLIFPPIWLIGAMVAMASKVWDYRDKWVGLAGPFLLTVLGTAAGVILAGGPSSLGHDVHIGWVSADIASRLAAVLGATYLAWRSVHGRRPAAVPPWNKPHRVS